MRLGDASLQQQQPAAAAAHGHSVLLSRPINHAVARCRQAGRQAPWASAFARGRPRERCYFNVRSKADISQLSTETKMMKDKSESGDAAKFADVSSDAVNPEQF